MISIVYLILRPIVNHAGFLKYIYIIPVQVDPIAPLTHAHCDDEHTVLASTAVH